MKKRIFSLLFAMGLILSTNVQANATYYIRPDSSNINVGYKNDNGEPFTSIEQEYYKEDYMRFKINEIRDITDEFDLGYIKYYNVDKIVLIDYTYTNLQYRSCPMFIEPEIVFVNSATEYSDLNAESCPKRLMDGEDYDYLPDKFRNHPALRPNETGSWKVGYIIHNKLNGKPHETIDINFNNVGNGCWKTIWSIPVQELSK